MIKVFKFFIANLLLVCLISSCKKSECGNSMTLSVSSNNITVGESFDITTPTTGDSDSYNWFGPGISTTTGSNKLTIFNAKYSSKGWYYCRKTLADCNKTIRDSIYVNIKLKQETPACTATNNYLKFSSIPSVSLTSISYGLDPIFNGMGFMASGAFGYPTDFRIVFNSYNGVFDPPDGVYNTTSVSSFDVTQDFQEVSLSFIYNSGYFHCQPNQKVYVSHVGGKVVVTMCDLIFSYVGTGLTTKCTAKITRP